MRKQIISVVALLLVTAATPYGATVSGLVVTAEEGTPLEAATISLGGEGLQVRSDAIGRFVVTGVSGDVIATISHVGYATQRGVRLESGADNRIALVRTVSMLDGIVVTANRYEKEAYKVSQPITAANSAEIEVRGHTIVSDVIRGFPGLDMNDAGPFRARPVIRGLFGTRILVLVDGERLNDQRDISAFAGVSMSLVDVNEIERVEVVNGPSSVLYGSDAMAGVINIVTKKNRFKSRMKPFVRYSGRYSTADQQHSNRVDFGVEAEKWSGSVGFQYREADRDFRPPDGWNRTEEFHVFRPGFYDTLNAEKGTSYSRDRLVNSKARVNNYDGKLAYRFNEHDRLDLDFGSFNGRDIGYPGVPNDSTPFLFFYPSHDRISISLGYTGLGLTEKLLRLETRIYYQEITKNFLTDFLGNIPPIPLGPPGSPSLNLLTSNNHTTVKKYGVNFQELHAVSDRSQVTFGFDFLREEITGAVTETTRLDFPFPGPASVFDTSYRASVPSNDWNALGLYVSGETDFGDIRTSLGLRYDNFWINTEETPGYVDDDDNLLPTDDEHYSSVNASLGLVYGLGADVNLVANVGTAYRVPNVVERFFFGSASGRQTRPNVDIKPERSVTVDFGIKAAHSEINYSLIGFYSDYSDFTQLVNYDSLASGHGYDPLWRYDNIDDISILGFEGLVEAELNNGIYGSVSFTYQRGENKTIDQPLFVSPIKSSLTVGFRHQPSSVFGDLTIRVVGSQDRVPDVTYLDDVATNGFTVVSATTGVRLFGNVRLSVTGHNLLDEIYSEPFNSRNPDNPVPEPGRNFVFSVSSSL